MSRESAFAGTRAATAIGFAMMAALSLASRVSPAQAPDSESDSRRVVILKATAPYLPAFLALDRSLRDSIRAGSKVPVELYAETLDRHRFPRKLLDQGQISRSQPVNALIAIPVFRSPACSDFACYGAGAR